MNPSAQGWIERYVTDYTDSVEDFQSHEELYKNLRDIGFIYGHTVDVILQPPLNLKGWLQDEKSKLALLHALYLTFRIETRTQDETLFLSSLLEFYNDIQPDTLDWFKKILPSDSIFLKLEKKIDNRIKTNQNLVSKNFSNLITNALLFLDVLSYQRFLKKNDSTIEYITQFEEKITSIVWSALSSKTIKSSHDDALLKLFETSLRFSRLDNIDLKEVHHLVIDPFLTTSEKLYLMDIACMAIWSDQMAEAKEHVFIMELGQKLRLSNNEITEALQAVEGFIQNHQDEIPYFNSSNPVKNFYDQTSLQVITLVTRNKKRIVKELVESKELMVLLTHATQRELNAKEKKKMKKQLLDLCKSIPALTIFLLPGGGLLLPLLVKFIPQLLPSAFNENLE
jgi:hypothetical protein